MSIEHIAPENPKAGEPLASNVGKIGNLILVPESLNNEVLGNKSFPEKKAAFKKEQVPMDEVLSKAGSWTAKDIDNRTKKLAELVQTKVFRV